MFAKFAIFVASLAIFAAAGPLPGGSDIQKSCNTGSVQCCNSVHSAQDQSVTSIIALLALKVQDATGQVGFNCSPITAVGVAGNSCNSQPVCCTENNYNGLIAAGCTPVNANL